MINQFPKRYIPNINSDYWGYGKAVEEFEEEFKKRYCPDKFVVATNSGTMSAFMIFKWLSIDGLKTVLTTPLGFCSPLEAAIMNGHHYNFNDIDSSLMMNDFDSNRYYESNILMTVLYGGSTHKLNKLEGEYLVVDSAHRLNSHGLNDDFTFYSFHCTKPLAMINGGLIACKDENAYDFFKNYRNFGRYAIGDTYGINQSGFKGYMDCVNAEIGLKSLETVNFENHWRYEIYEYYKIHLDKKYKVVEHDGLSSVYLATLILPDSFSAKNMRKYLRDNMIESILHYPMLHKTMHFTNGQILPNADSLRDRIVNLPCHHQMSNNDIKYIIEKVNNYKGE